MLTIDKALELESKEELLNELKEHVRVRDTMGGALYWNVVNDECRQIARRCAALGADGAEIEQILNS